jgi:hypothetical protein
LLGCSFEKGGGEASGLELNSVLNLSSTKPREVISNERMGTILYGAR